MHSHALGASILVVCMPVALAQIRLGIILDESGTPISGASVTGSCFEPQSTDEQGRFEIPAGAPCRLRIAAEGFETAHLDITGSESPQIKLRLRVRHEAVNVDAQSDLEAAAMPIDRTSLAALPSLGLDALAPLVEMLDGAALGEVGPTVVVDGLETPGAKVPPGAIQEVRLFDNPYAAEFRRPGRGRIEIITRKTAQEFHGDLRAAIRDSRLDARNAFAITRPPQQRRAYEGSLVGPWGSGRAFVISFEREEDDLQSLVFARTPAGEVRQNVATPGRSSALTTGSSFAHGERGFSTARYQFERQSEANQGVGGFRLPEAGYAARETDHELRYSYRGTLSAHWTAGIRTRFEIERSLEVSRNPGKPAIVVQEAFTGGGAQVDRSSDQRDFQGTADLAFSGQRHQLRTGIDIPGVSRRSGDDRSDFDGVYSFASIDDYLANRPFAFVRNHGISGWRFALREFGGYIQDDMRLHERFQLGLGVRFDRHSAIRDWNNFAPRLSVALAADAKRRLIFRGGAGLFYDLVPPSIVEDAIRFDGHRVYRVLVTPADTGVTPPPSVTRLDPGMRSPYTLHANTTLEYRAVKAAVMTITWLTARGVKQLRSRDVNAPHPGSPSRPDSSAAIIRRIESSACLRRHSLEIAIRGKIARFEGLARYTLSRTLNDSSGAHSLPADNYDLAAEWGRADFDRRHRLQIIGSLPIARGFVLGISADASSGGPYSVTTGTDDNHDGRASDRPAGERRNARQGPGSARVNVRLSRTLHKTVSLAVDAMNLTNRVNFGNPVGNRRSPFFGLPVSSAPARRLQASIRFQF